MESRVKLLGHPIHPMLVVLPLGLFVMSVIFDALSLARDNVIFGVVAYWNILAGVIGGLLAAVFGLIDWLAIPDGTRAKRIGLLHGGTNVLVVLLFAYSWWTRSNTVDAMPTTTLFAVQVIALLMGAFAGWLGGELVDRLGVGVSPNANLNARSSLDGPAEPARDAGPARAP